MRKFLGFSVAAMAAIAEQAFATMRPVNGLGHQIGPGKKTHKRLTDGTVSTEFVGGVKSRQVERAEGRAELKSMDRRAKRRERDSRAKDLARRVDARHSVELDRRDARFGVHEIIERGSFGHFRRKRFA